MNVKYKILLFLLLPTLAFGHQGDTEFKRTIVKELSVNSNATFEVANKYGKIVIHTWPKNEIKASIIITGYGKNDAEAKDIANAVDVAVNASPGHVSMRTSYSPGKGGSSWRFWDDRKGSTKDYVNINYELYVPQSLSMFTLENNFGDVIADRLPFPAKMRLNYCFYAIREASKPLEMQMNYCNKGKIEKAGQVSLRADYSDVRVENVERLDARSNYSDYNIGNAGALNVKSNYDEYKVQQLNTIDASGNYTSFNINRLQERADVRLVYGELNASQLSTSFKGGNIQLTYTDVKIGIPQKLGLQIMVNLNYGDLEVEGLSLKNENSIKKNHQLSYTAFTAGGGEQSPKLSISGTQSDVELTGR